MPKTLGTCQCSSKPTVPTREDLSFPQEAVYSLHVERNRGRSQILAVACTIEQIREIAAGIAEERATLQSPVRD